MSLCSPTQFPFHNSKNHLFLYHQLLKKKKTTTKQLLYKLSEFQVRLELNSGTISHKVPRKPLYAPIEKAPKHLTRSHPATILNGQHQPGAAAHFYQSRTAVSGANPGWPGNFRQSRHLAPRARRRLATVLVQWMPNGHWLPEKGYHQATERLTRLLQLSMKNLSSSAAAVTFEHSRWKHMC